MPEVERQIDVRSAIRDRGRGLTYAEIGKKQGVSAPGIFKALKGLEKLAVNTEQLEDYRKREVSLIDAAKMKYLVAAVNETKLKKASALQCITGFAVLTDKSLLLQGKATQIVETKSLQIQLKAELDKLQAEREQVLSAEIVGSSTQVTSDNVNK